MIIVVARWEDGWFEPIVEWRMWKQLKHAMGIDRFIFTPVRKNLCHLKDVDQYETMAGALDAVPNGITKVFLEPKGGNCLMSAPTDDVAFIVGNAMSDNLKHIHPSDAYRIRTPGDADMFGMQAAAIALAVGYGQ